MAEKMPLTFDEAAEGLRSWADTLRNRIASAIPEARETLRGDAPLPDGCPSREAMASLVLGKLGSDIDEVMGFYDELRTSIGLAPKYRGGR